MPNPNQQSGQKTAAPTVSAEEAAVMAELELGATKQAQASQAAATEARAAAAGTVAQRPAQKAQYAPRVAGDIPVTCLKTEPFCKMGKRAYNLVRGQEIEMDPGHAAELAQGGWIAPVTVIVSR